MSCITLVDVIKTMYLDIEPISGRLLQPIARIGRELKFVSYLLLEFTGAFCVCQLI